jgi:O-antigen/teichoic acid export membrane protein
MSSKSVPQGPNMDVDVGAPPADLTGVVVSGVRWKTLSRGVSIVTRVLVLVILARLLTPEDYGIAGMAIVVTSFALILTDPALSAALIQRPTIDERDRSSVFWLAAGIGVVLTLLGVAASGLVADFFGEEQVQELFIVTSLSLLPASLAVTPYALLTRRLAYRELEIRQMIAIVSGGIVGVTAAIAGLGPWAIVLNSVVYMFTSTALLWLLSDWRPRAMFSMERVRALRGFSARIFSASLFTWGGANLDKTLIGRVLGASSLGAYSLAFSAMLVPNELVSRPVYQSVSPAFSRIQNERKRLERVWRRSKQVSVAAIAPVLVALIVVAPDLVPVVFGHQWDEAIVPLQLLCVGALAKALVALHYSVLQACGEASSVLRLAALSSIVQFVALLAGLNWGIVGVSAFYAGATLLMVVPSTWITTRGVSFSFWPALRAGGDMLPAAFAAGAVGLATRMLLVEVGAPEASRVLVVGTLIFLVYVALVRVIAPSVLHEVRKVVPIPARIPLVGGAREPRRPGGTFADPGYDEVRQRLGEVKNE